MARLYLSQMVAVDLEKLRSSILRLGAIPICGPGWGPRQRQGLFLPLVKPDSAVRAFLGGLKEEAASTASTPPNSPKSWWRLLLHLLPLSPPGALSPRDENQPDEYGRQFLRSPSSLIRYEDVQVCIFSELEISSWTADPAARSVATCGNWE